MGSVLPEVNLISFPPRWFADPPSSAAYDYIFTGKVPASYEQRGALRSMISNEARDVPRAILNSFVVATAVMFINLVFGSMAAYAYARLRFPGRAVMFNFVLMSRLIPTVALAVPYYLIVFKLGLLNSFWALIAIYSVLTLPFTILVLTLYFRAVPEEIDEAAQVEGASPWQRPAGHHAAALAAEPGRRRTVRLHAGLQRVPLRPLHHDQPGAPDIAGHPRRASVNTDVSWSMLMASIAIGLVPTLIWPSRSGAIWSAA